MRYHKQSIKGRKTKQVNYRAQRALQKSEIGKVQFCKRTGCDRRLPGCHPRISEM
jgi:hypothetical protein